ncbi:MAG: Type III pantothenate kinase [Phycisphaerae bacterium]|nr:Type III pantothenate kinase [Phycisphaerae bacterium]
MIRVPREFNPDAPVLLVNIGNTNTALAMWGRDEVSRVVAVPTGQAAAFDDALAAMVETFSHDGPAASVIASVVPAALAALRERLDEVFDRVPLVLGEQVGLPIDVDLDDPTTVGMDRVCGAAAAFDRLGRSCVVVSFGTAVTVDLVNDDGAFVGGAILPGVRLQLAALHDRAAQLPRVEPAFPKNVIGRTTAEAMQNGVCRGIAGSVRWLVEAYATELHAWPQVVATGGDAVFMAPHCDFLDNVVPDLALRGLGLAYQKHLARMGV